MASVLRTNLTPILNLVLARLQEVTGFDAGAVFLSQRRKLPYDRLGDEFVWVRLGSKVTDAAVWEGAGRYDSREARRLHVTARLRLALDTPDASGSALTDESLGLIALVAAVEDALDGFFPTDPDTKDVYAVQPLQPLAGPEPAHDPKQTEWIEEELVYLVVYEKALDQTYTGGG